MIRPHLAQMGKIPASCYRNKWQRSMATDARIAVGIVVSGFTDMRTAPCVLVCGKLCAGRSLRRSKPIVNGEQTPCA